LGIVPAGGWLLPPYGGSLGIVCSFEEFLLKTLDIRGRYCIIEKTKEKKMKTWDITYTTDDSIVAGWRYTIVYADDIVGAINVVLQSQPEDRKVVEIISVKIVE
jgi:hypothetical protein